ncbi:leucine-zipper-like transcriptional regulator 1, putative [Plasmodium gallinaceum]|uniref:Leucine-zipper-like transcriptional regulator 1, putative n=1 Tax=Plasmodium gallinaceum TaxID=5849 RepID=A0A1J1GTB4_PLAGA|nr:leucine-zipper-like transcriptional regulator 1, putative [Plasmodium gallinaceum]CRG95774.1 leucine-zipper-like transcriptional regulator 1, putative [Plasmodium gallinaceum]
MITKEKNNENRLSSSSLKGEINEKILNSPFNKNLKKIQEDYTHNLKKSDREYIIRCDPNFGRKCSSIQNDIKDFITDTAINDCKSKEKNKVSDNVHVKNRSFHFSSDDKYIFISDSRDYFKIEEFQEIKMPNNLSIENSISQNTLNNKDASLCFSKENSTKFLNKIKNNISNNRNKYNKKKYSELIKNINVDIYSKCWISQKFKKRNTYINDRKIIRESTSFHNCKRNSFWNDIKDSYDRYYDKEHNSAFSFPSNRASHTCNIIENRLFLFGGWNGQKALNDLYVYDIEQKKWFFVDYKKAEYYFEKIKALKKYYSKMNYYSLEKNLTYKNIHIPSFESETSEDEEIEEEQRSRKKERKNIEIKDREEEIQEIDIEQVEDEEDREDEYGEDEENEDKEYKDEEGELKNKSEKYDIKGGKKKVKKLKFTIKLNDDYDYYSLFSKRTSVNYNILSSIYEGDIKEKFYVPLPRNNHASCCINEKIYIFGGHDSEKWLDDMHILNVNGAVNSLGKLNLKNSKCNSFYKKCKVESSSCSSSSLYSEEPIEEKDSCSHNHIYFIEIKKKKFEYWPSQRACHTLNAVRNKLYLFGGFDGNNCSNNVEIFDTEKRKWICADTIGSIPCPRNAHSMINLNNNLYLFGGRSINSYLNDLFMLNTKKLIWTEIKFSNFLLPCIAGHTSCLLFKKIFLFGGYNGNERLNSTYIIDIKRKNITLIPPKKNTPHCRQRHTCCVYKEKQIFVFGGFDGNTWYNDLCIFDASKIEQKMLTDISIKNIFKKLHNLVNNPQFSDLTIIVQNKKIYAHKNILCIHDSYFKSLFSDNSVQDKKCILEVSNWSYESYIKMIEFLYTGRLKNIYNISYTILTEIMGLSNEYSIHILKGLCINALIIKININNACYLLKHADMYNAIELKYHCLNFIKVNSQHIIFTKGFEELKSNPSLIVDISKLCLNHI